MTDLEVARLVEFTEAEAYLQHAKLPPSVVHRFGFERKEIGSVVMLLATRASRQGFHRVFGLGLNSPTTEAEIDEIIQTYRRKDLSCTIRLSPLAQPPDIRQWLLDRGLVKGDSSAVMYRGTEPVPEVQTSFRIEEVTPSTVALFEKTFCGAFEIPEELAPVGMAGLRNWKHYLGFDGKDAVATGALFVRGDVGWLGMGGTLLSHRRQGAQGAILSETTD